MQEIIIQPEQIALLAQEGGKFIFKQSAENEFIKLLETQLLINEAVEYVKTKILEAGREIDPAFKGVKGARLECSVRKYGSRYLVKEKSKCGAFLELTEHLDSSAVEEYEKEHGTLPEGIIESEREEKLSISIKE